MMLIVFSFEMSVLTSQRNILGDGILQNVSRLVLVFLRSSKEIQKWNTREVLQDFVWNTRITEVAGEILSYIRVRERTETDGVG
jgi:hypothetical protein